MVMPIILFIISVLAVLIGLVKGWWYVVFSSTHTRYSMCINLCRSNLLPGGRRMRTIIAIWLPSCFAALCSLLVLYSTFFIIPAIFGIADARARYKDFLFITSCKSYDNGSFYLRTLQKYKHSACQRYAAIAAIPGAMSTYRRMGYKWYHLLPDGTFSRNSPYLKLKFYKTLLGV